MTWFQNVQVLVSVVEDSDVHKSLCRREHSPVKVGMLDMWDPPTIVSETLALHRNTLDESPFNNQVHTPI